MLAPYIQEEGYIVYKNVGLNYFLPLGLIKMDENNLKIFERGEFQFVFILEYKGTTYRFAVEFNKKKPIDKIDEYIEEQKEIELKINLCEQANFPLLLIFSEKEVINSEAQEELSKFIINIYLGLVSFEKLKSQNKVKQTELYLPTTEYLPLLKMKKKLVTHGIYSSSGIILDNGVESILWNRTKITRIIPPWKDWERYWGSEVIFEILKGTKPVFKSSKKVEIKGYGGKEIPIQDNELWYITEQLALYLCLLDSEKNFFAKNTT